MKSFEEIEKYIKEHSLKSEKQIAKDLKLEREEVRILILYFQKGAENKKEILEKSKGKYILGI